MPSARLQVQEDKIFGLAPLERKASRSPSNQNNQLPADGNIFNGKAKQRAICQRPNAGHFCCCTYAEVQGSGSRFYDNHSSSCLRCWDEPLELSTENPPSERDRASQAMNPTNDTCTAAKVPGLCFRRMPPRPRGPRLQGAISEAHAVRPNSFPRL